MDKKNQPVLTHVTYRPKKGKEEQLFDLVKRHWPALHKAGLVTKEPATIWLDSIQLQNGEMTGFQPARATEVGYSCATIGNIFYQGQGSDVDLLVHDATGGRQATVNYRVIDYWGQEVTNGQQRVPISEKAGKVSMRSRKTALSSVNTSACSGERAVAVRGEPVRSASSPRTSPAPR